MSSDQWAFGWDAIASLASAAAVVVAAGAVAFDLFRTRAERSERETSRALQIAAETRNQAEHVVAWTDVALDYDDPQIDGYGGTQFVWAHNASDSPVYEVAITHTWLDGQGPYVFVRSVLPPSPTPTLLLQYDHDRTDERPPDRDSSELRAISFRDTAGRWWERDTSGHLNALPARPVNPDSTTVVAKPT